MSTKQLLRRAKALFNSPYVTASTNRHNRKQWVKSVLYLGDKWLLATPVMRKDR